MPEELLEIWQILSVFARASTVAVLKQSFVQADWLDV